MLTKSGKFCSLYSTAATEESSGVIAAKENAEGLCGDTSDRPLNKGFLCIAVPPDISGI
jgi:hypothetical protein